MVSATLGAMYSQSQILTQIVLRLFSLPSNSSVTEFGTPLVLVCAKTKDKLINSNPGLRFKLEI